MVFAGWTFSGDGSGALDAGVKYAGNSSYRSYLATASAIARANELIHDTFLEPQACITLWIRRYRQSTLSGNQSRTYIRHTEYANVECIQAAYDTWEKHRVTFWYDAAANTKWGRDERWISGAWVQQGGDINCGSGSPVAGSIVLRAWAYSTGASRAHHIYFDELEVSA